MNTRDLCPWCSKGRKKSNDKCLSVNGEVFCCHHCHRTGKVVNGKYVLASKYTIPVMQASALTQEVIDYFQSRGISQDVLEKNKVGYNGKEIMFHYFKQGVLVNIKYRSLNKTFRQESGAEKVFYGLDDIDPKEVVVVEGEMDKLSLSKAGYDSVISVPDGAPAPNTKSYETKFSYIGNCEEQIEAVEKFIIAVDNDAPGRKLKEELIRRLGPDKCWVVKWPDGCKDANDVLLKFGSIKLLSLIDDAKPVPVEGIFTGDDISNELDSLYEAGLPGGVSTGWHTVDKYYTVKPGEVTVVTGIPNHGKSNWQTALMVNIAQSEGWCFAVFSPENQPLQRHAAQIVAMYANKPFRRGLTERMTIEELGKAKHWLNEHFVFILPPDDQLTVEAILTKAKIAVARYGINGMVIDPWNEIDHNRPNRQSETEYISDCLTKIRRFAAKYQVHVWLVAHPTKLQKDKATGKYPVPTPYDIAGSAHFRNKADCCICIWRDVENEYQSVEIHVQKVRFREVGSAGMAKLRYDFLTGRYL